MVKLMNMYIIFQYIGETWSAQWVTSKLLKHIS